MSLATPLSCQKLIINGLLSSLGCQFFTPLEYCKDVIQRKVIGKGPPSIGKKHYSNQIKNTLLKGKENLAVCVAIVRPTSLKTKQKSNDDMSFSPLWYLYSMYPYPHAVYEAKSIRGIRPFMWQKCSAASAQCHGGGETGSRRMPRTVGWPMALLRHKKG